MNAEQITVALGGRWDAAQGFARCPAHDDRHPSLSLADGRDGRLLVKCHAGCDGRTVLGALRRRGLLNGSGKSGLANLATSRLARRCVDDAEKIGKARRLWECGSEARRSPVEHYFASRGIGLRPPSSLRWVRLCWHPSGARHPAMLGRIDNIEGELIGVLRTYLRIDGSGKMLVEPVRAILGHAAGGAVRLAPADDVLMVAEGIETALAAMQACSMPAWAALSTSGLMSLILPRVVRTVVILADHDHSGAGERAARTAAQRWLAQDRQVRIAMPPWPGSDFNDVLVGKATGQIREIRRVA
jgi:hypothetical protein